MNTAAVRQIPALRQRYAARSNKTYVPVSTLMAFLILPIVTPQVDARTPINANAVIAFIDTGINPYHDVFADSSPRAYRHPSTYIRGYPKNAQALNLSLNEPNYWKAVKADCDEIWSKIEPRKLYWFPGTKIIGVIAFVEDSAEPGPVNCDVAEPSGGLIRDQQGHGTMVASRGASNEYGACQDCLVVSVQFPGTVNPLSPAGSTQPSVDAITWAADNANWIDAQSNSWGPVAPGWEPTGQTGIVTANPELVRAVEEVSSKHAAFWASGNGAAFRGGVAGHPTPLAAHMTPSTIIVGGHDSGYVNTWPGFPPHLVADSCDAWGAEVFETSKSGERIAGGTSGATPFAAGGAAQILLDARRILGDAATGVTRSIVAQGRRGVVRNGPLADGKFTLNEWREVTLKTATPRPAGQKNDGPVCTAGPYMPTPIRWDQVPAGYPEYLHIGYGAVDDKSLQLALKVLLGKEDMPDRTETDEFFARDREMREATHSVFGSWVAI